MKRTASVVAGLTAIVAMGTAASASWSSHSSGAATARSTTLPAGPTPSAPTAGSQSSANITVSWPATTYVGISNEVAGYAIIRFKGGVADTIGGTCTGTVAAPTHTCVDTVSTNGTYSYKITPKSGSWTGAPGSASGTVTVTLPPAVASVSPNSRGQNSLATTITITGTGFTSGTGLSVNFGANTSTTAVTFVNSTTITASVAVAAAAATGPRNVTVTNGGVGGATMTCANCFTVSAGPTVNSGSPAAATIGHGAANAATFTIAGTGFVSGFTATTSDPNYVVTSTAFTSSTSISVTVRNDYGNNGTHNATLTITNPDGGSITTGAVLKNN